MHGLALLDAFRRTGDAATLREAEAVLRHVVVGSGDDDPVSWEAANTLGRVLCQKHSSFGSADALDEAIELFRQVVDACWTFYADRFVFANNLGMALADRYERQGRTGDLVEAIRAYRVAVDGARERGVAIAGTASGLGSALMLRYHLTSDLDLLREAMEVCRGGLADGSGDVEGLGWCMYHLAAALAAAYRAGLDGADAAEAQMWAQRAVETDPPYRERRALFLSQLGVTLTLQGRPDGEVDRLDRANRALTAALDLIPVEHSRRAGFLGNLAAAALRQYRLTGRRAALDTAVKSFSDAVACCQPGDVDRVTWLAALGGAQYARYQATDQPAALNHAVAAYEAAASVLPAGDSFRADVLSSLSRVLVERHAVGDLGRAVAMSREAVASCPPSHRSHAGVCNDLAGALRRWADQFTRPDRPVSADVGAALTEAEEVLRAVLRSPRLDRDAAQQTSHNLALMLIQNPDAGPMALAEAERLLRAAAVQHPSDAARSTVVLKNLAALMRRRWWDTGSESARREAVCLFLKVAASDTATPSTVVTAAAAAGRLAAEVGEWEQAADAFAVAVRTLPDVASRAHLRHEQEEGLARYAGLASDATACALAAGRRLQALELVEQGRSILRDRARESWGPLARLRAVAPELAERYVELTRFLDSDPPSLRTGELSITDMLTAVRTGEERQRLETERRALIDRIRGMGFLDFLAPIRASDLLASVPDGAVIVINVSDYRSDALLLRPGRLDTIELAAVTPSAVDEELSRLHEAVGVRRRDLTPAEPVASRIDSDRAITGVLTWLWRSIAEPVIDLVGPQTRRLRVWWCPTGPLAFLPLHAASDHTGAGSGVAVMDHIVSSYTFTVRELAGPAAAPPETPMMLAVAVPHTPGANHLPGARREIDVVATTAPVACRLVDTDATRLRILAELPRHRWFHFAGHGVQHPNDPDRAGLLPFDHETSGPVTVADIGRLHLESAELAFLNACETALGREHLADESLHIAAAMRTAGFSHVVASLWPVDDAVAAAVAAEFYRRVVDRTADGVATALHDAICAIRSGSAAGPWQWAPFIHAGR